MAQRTLALCDGKYIGIETIYTVINGQQINNPDKLKNLREKSRKNELFCPCGCGANLILVAGDKNLREQHFREKNGTGCLECRAQTEGKTSRDSKIVMKCWLDDKLGALDIESRVPINTVEDSKRKLEFTFLSREKKFAVRYWRSRASIMADNLDILTGNTSDIYVVYIVDESNGGTDGQYPEALMKIQERQGFCLLMSTQDEKYDKAMLMATHYAQDIDGFWEEIVLAYGNIYDFLINEKNEIVFADKTLNQICLVEKEKHTIHIEEERQKRIQEEQICQEQREKAREKLLKEKEENKKKQEELYRQYEIERKRKEEGFARSIVSDIEQQEKAIIDMDGNRWVKCEFCGKIAMEKEFSSYGGRNHVNLGTCKECSNNNPEVQRRLEIKIDSVKRKYDADVCPECGGKLRKRTGRYGDFWGCSNYPSCKYTKK